MNQEKIMGNKKDLLCPKTKDGKHRLTFAGVGIKRCTECGKFIYVKIEDAS